MPHTCLIYDEYLAPPAYFVYYEYLVFRCYMNVRYFLLFPSFLPIFSMYVLYLTRFMNLNIL